MAEQLVGNKPAIFEMDKNPSYKNPGETWGKNKIDMAMWDYLEEGAAILDRAADASQFMEGDKYVFSKVGIAFSKKAKSSSANTLASKMFAHNI